MFPFEEEGKFKTKSPQSPELLDQDTILTHDRDLIESTYDKIRVFENPLDFDIPQETTFQDFYPPSSEEESVILDWKHFFIYFYSRAPSFLFKFINYYLQGFH